MPAIDVGVDWRGEFFNVHFAAGDRVEVAVVDAWPEKQQLLLGVRDGVEKSKFLCGHDERHWFVAAIPESERGVSGIAQAMVALQPESVRAAVAAKKPADPFARKNTAYLRQGEWFFVPTPGLDVDPGCDPPRADHARPRQPAHRRAPVPVRRGGGVRGLRLPDRLTAAEFAKLPVNRVRRGAPWREMVRGAAVYARGTVRHPDHATLVLHPWHRVEMNAEQRARAMRHVAFLDQHV